MYEVIKLLVKHYFLLDKKSSSKTRNNPANDIKKSGLVSLKARKKRQIIIKKLTNKERISPLRKRLKKKNKKKKSDIKKGGIKETFVFKKIIKSDGEK